MKKEMILYLSYEEKKKIIEDFSELWNVYFGFFSKSIEEIIINEEQEKQFFEVQTKIASSLYAFAKVTETFFSGGNDILKLLSVTASLRHLSQLTDSQFSKYQVDWHGIYLDINKAYGLFVRREGKPVPELGRHKKRRHILN